MNDLKRIEICFRFSFLIKLNKIHYIMSQSGTTDLNKSASNNLNNKGAPLIPMNRIRTIMKSSPEISNINQETLYSVCKATVCLLN